MRLLRPRPAPPASAPNVAPTSAIDFDKTAFVEAVYRGVLRRPADLPGLAAYVAALTSGRMSPPQVVETIARGKEFAALSGAALDGYSLAADPQFAAFRTPEIVAVSARLSANGGVDRATFDRLHDEAMAGQDEEGRTYLTLHRARFLELFQAAGVLLAGRPSPRLLEVGSCQVTPWWPRLVPGVRFSVMNRPTSPTTAGAEREVFRDLNTQPPAGPDELGRFDLIVFTEVLEHLTAYAPTLIAGLLALLEPDGALYLTTPNFFSARKLGLMARRINPQAPFPVSNADTHHHMREFAMGELLEMVVEAGGVVRAWTFSDCWDEVEVPEHARANMVAVAGRGA